MGFPKGFLWGGSISAAQIEGGWNEGGKSPVLVDYCTAGSTKERRQIWYLDKDGKRVALADFAAHLPEEREQLTRDKGFWFEKEAAISEHSVAEVVAGFKANPNLLVRTEIINKETKHKTILSREESIKENELPEN